MPNLLHSKNKGALTMRLNILAFLSSTLSSQTWVGNCCFFNDIVFNLLNTYLLTFFFFLTFGKTHPGRKAFFFLTEKKLHFLPSGAYSTSQFLKEELTKTVAQMTKSSKVSSAEKRLTSLLDCLLTSISQPPHMLRVLQNAQENCIPQISDLSRDSYCDILHTLF